MQAAVMYDTERPVYTRFTEPRASDGSIVVAVRAAALSGFDRAVARRTHYMTMPKGPIVLGREGVALRDDGARIYFNVRAPVAPFGSMAQRTLIDPRLTFPVPDAVADDVAAALGNAGLAAWLALSWRGRLQRGETVLILGATGISGSIAVTAAKRLGARRVVAVGRNPEALLRAKRAGADAVVNLAEAATDLTAAYREAAGGDIDLAIDYLCGPPGEAALEVLATYGRLIHVGTSVSRTMTLVGASTRRTCADILGFAYYHAPIELQDQAYAQLCRLAAASELALDFDARPLAEISEAWDLQAAQSRRRQVLIPQA